MTDIIALRWHNARTTGHTAHQDVYTSQCAAARNLTTDARDLQGWSLICKRFGCPPPPRSSANIISLFCRIGRVRSKVCLSGGCCIYAVQRCKCGLFYIWSAPRHFGHVNRFYLLTSLLTKFNFGTGSDPDPAGGAHNTLPNQWRIQNFWNGGARQFIRSVFIYRKSAQRNKCLLHGKNRLFEKNMSQ